MIDSAASSTASVNSSTNSAASNSFSQGSLKKEKLPFLKKSPLKFIFSVMNLGFSYLFSVFPIYPFVMNFGSFLMLLQFYLPSLLVTTPIYTKDNQTIAIVKFLSFFSCFFPVGTPPDIVKYFFFIYLIGLSIAMTCVVTATFYFSKTSAVPEPLVKVTFALCSTKLFLTVPAMATSAILFFGDCRNSTSCFVIAILIILIFFFASTLGYFLENRSLFFSPYPLATYCQRSQMISYVFSGVISFLATTIGLIQKKFSAFVFACVLILYIVWIFLEKKAVLIRAIEFNAFYATMISAISNLIINYTAHHLDLKLPLYYHLVNMIVWVITFFLVQLFHKRSQIKSLKLLDSFEENSDTMKIHIKNGSQLIPIIVNGYHSAHQYCLSNEVFKDAIDSFPTDYNLVICYAKFLTIFPEMSTELNWALLRLKREPTFKRKLDKYFISQISTILRRRDASLNYELKYKIHHLNSLIQKAKLRISNAVEVQLNGYKQDIDSTFDFASNTIKSINLKFLQLRNYHGNNTYSLRAEASFQKDIITNYDLAEQLFDQARENSIGGRSTYVDAPYLYGQFFFPLIPRKVAKKLSIDTNTQQASSADTIDVGKEDMRLNAEDRYRHRILWSLINEVKFPTIKRTVIYFIISMVIFSLIPYIILVVQYPTIEEHMRKSIYFMRHSAANRILFSTYLTIVFRSYFESKSYFVGQCELVNSSKYEINIENFGNGGKTFPDVVGDSCQSSFQISYFSRIADKMMEDLVFMNMFQTKSKSFIKTKEILFDEKYVFYEAKQTTTDISKIINLTRTFQQEFVSITSGQFNNDAMLSSNEFTFFFINILKNFQKISDILQESTQNLVLFIDYLCKAYNYDFTFVEIFCIVLIAIVHINCCYFLGEAIRKQKRQVIHCFNALPKNALNQMILKLGSIPVNTTTKQQHQQYFSEDTGDSIEKNERHEKSSMILQSLYKGKRNKASQFYTIIAIILLLLYTMFYTACFETFKRTPANLITYMPKVYYISEVYSRISLAICALGALAIDDPLFEQVGFTKSEFESLFLINLNESCNAIQSFFGNGMLDKFHMFMVSKKTKQKHSYQLYFNNGNRNIANKNDFCVYEVTEGKEIYEQISFLSLCLYLLQTMGEIGNDGFLIYQNDSLELLFHLQLHRMYNQFANELDQSVTDSIEEVYIKTKILFYLLPTLAVVAICSATITLISFLSNVPENLRIILRMILHAPTDMILHSQYINSVLAGNLDIREMPKVKLSDSIFCNTIEYFPAGIVFFNSQKAITMINKAGAKILGDNVTSLPFELNLDVDCCIGLEHNGKYLQISHIGYDELGNTRIVIQDTTLNEFHRKQIHIEEEKYFNMVKKAIPKRILSSFIKKEPISMMSPSVTAMVISINRVCAQFKNSQNCFNQTNNKISCSHSSGNGCNNLNINANEKIEKIELHDSEINSLYVAFCERLTKQLDQFTTIPSIEIIVDRFFLFGGIFDPLISAEKSAIETIEFALIALEIAMDMGIEISIGISSGGPVVCGVIDVKRPYFMFFGDVLDFASSLCSCGDNGQIHLSRSTYELVYGKFNIKERSISMTESREAVTYTICPEY